MHEIRHFITYTYVSELAGWCIFNDGNAIGFTQNKSEFEGIPVILMYRFIKLRSQTDNKDISLQTINQINIYFNDTCINRNEIDANINNRSITVETVKRLDNNAPGINKWLNDDIMEVYMQLLFDQYNSSINMSSLLNTHT